MKQELFTVVSNEALAPSVFRLVLAGNTDAITTPGQFVNLQLQGKFLRRPLSVCHKAGDKLTLIYKVVGHGTAQLATAVPGDTFDLLTGLGNGFDTAPSGDRPLLVGGGVGVPPLYWLCEQLMKEGKKTQVILGFNTRSEVFYEAEFRALGADVTVTTADGSCGTKGFVTAAMEGADYTYFYTCGPHPMLKAVNDASKTGGQLSFEERMGCGFGACMGCTCHTKSGPKRVCKEGPVFLKEDVEW